MHNLFLWRGSLLPLGCEAGPMEATEIILGVGDAWVGSASHSSGSKLPRHKNRLCIRGLQHDPPA